MSASRGENSLARAATAAVALIALAVPALAVAGKTTSYSGTFQDETGSVSFKLKRSHGERELAHWKWSGFPVKCDDGDQLSKGRYLFSLKVRNQKFQGRAVKRDKQGEVVGGAKVTGLFGPGYEAASGTFRVWGDIPGEKPGTTHPNCDSTGGTWDAYEEIRPVR